jgi:hypothetical protein
LLLHERLVLLVIKKEISSNSVKSVSACGGIESAVSRCSAIHHKQLRMVIAEGGHESLDGQSVCCKGTTHVIVHADGVRHGAKIASKDFRDLDLRRSCFDAAGSHGFATDCRKRLMHQQLLAEPVGAFGEARAEWRTGKH